VPEYLKPPVIPAAVLNWFSCQPDFPALAGDMAEEFQQRIATMGAARANRWYWRESFRNACALTVREVQRTPVRTMAMAVCLFLAVSVLSGLYVMVAFWPRSLDLFRLALGYFQSNAPSVVWDPIEIVLIPIQRDFALLFQFAAAFGMGWIGARRLPGREWALALMFTLISICISVPAARYVILASRSMFGGPALPGFVVTVATLRMIGFCLGSLWIRQSRAGKPAAEQTC